MEGQIAELSISIDAPPDVHVNELEELTYNLRDELLVLDIGSAQQPRTAETPTGAMAVDWVDVGELLIELAPVLIPSAVALLKVWLETLAKGPKKTHLRVLVTTGKVTVALEYGMSKEAAETAEANLLQAAESAPSM